LLLPIFYFKIRSFWALYLAGGFFGIATEGVVIPLIYTESLTWPALSWHVLADVILGWYVVRHVLIKNQPLYTVLLAGAMGLFWAFWAPWTHIGEEPFIPEPSRFTGFVLFASASLFCGYIILGKKPGQVHLMRQTGRCGMRAICATTFFDIFCSGVTGAGRRR
jgi:hypothetical protein